MIDVKSSDFKAKIAKFLRIVKAGEVVQILERDTPIARVTNIPSSRALNYLKPSKSMNGLAELVSKVKSSPKIDVVETLLEDRKKR